MAVYLVYRSHYDDPAGKRLKRFDDASVLDWFRNRWRLSDDPEEVGRLIDEEIGFYVYGLSSLFEHAIEDALPAPRTDRKLARYLDDHLYSEGPILHQPHLLTVQTDDDELQVCYYVFDDEYLAQHGKRAAYLLNDGWRLPGGHADGPFEPTEPIDEEPWGPAGKGAGTTYVAVVAYRDSGNLEDLSPAARIESVRLPDLARYLAETTPADTRGGYLLLLRSQLLAAPLTTDPAEEGFRSALLDDPGDEASWRAYSDWLQERGDRPAGLLLLEQALKAFARFPVIRLPAAVWNTLPVQLLTPSLRNHQALLQRILATEPEDEWYSGRPHSHSPEKSRVQVEEHVAQLCLHTERWDETDLYQQLIFFDDQWAAAHPDLANGILRYTRAWDVLSPDGPHDEDED
jgi:uncharacterized protein (TIGR02996 family)